MARDLSDLVAKMTLAEKASLCSGSGMWQTQGIPRLNIPQILMTDGPHGLRKPKEQDGIGISESIPATCFPSAAALACSWDRELVGKVGAALGRECQAEGVAILLGPGANIKRSPLCGRNFEYFSEDPYLSSELAASHITGVQSQGVGTSLKHFVANNQEQRRMSVDAIIDQRTLREIYLASFEGAVKQGKPWTVMCSYNRVNGEYVGEHPFLLHQVLRDEWGFEGIVVSDWGAVNDRVLGLVAGLELEMPTTNGLNDRKIIEAVEQGELSESVLDQAVERLLTIIFRVVDNSKPNATYEPKEHHSLARQVAEECMVLLKNEDSILPLAKGADIAVIGQLAKRPRYQGGGSSHVNPTKIDQPYLEMTKKLNRNGNIAHAQGYHLDSDQDDNQLIEEAVSLAARCDVAVVFMGLPDHYESEGFDRKHLRIPPNQVSLLQAIAKVQSEVVVVLSNGAPIEMPWLPKVKGLLEGYLGGQAQGGAIANLLFGDANPCGKLGESFPLKLSDNPSWLNFPGEGDKVEYREGVFVGYRYYDKKQLTPLFPFGFGLSYTDFSYSELTVSNQEIRDDETLTVSCQITNTGNRFGKEIVQLYVGLPDSKVIRPLKELRGFAKVSLEPEETKQVSFVLDKRAFSYYNEALGDWCVESGEYQIMIGRSSTDIPLQQTVLIHSTVEVLEPIHRNSLVGDLLQNPRTKPLAMELLAQIQATLGIAPLAEGEKPDMMSAMVEYLPLRSLVYFSRGAFSEEMLNQLISRLNKSLGLNQH